MEGNEEFTQRELGIITGYSCFAAVCRFERRTYRHLTQCTEPPWGVFRK